jgi:hypothetical protein
LIRWLRPRTAGVDVDRTFVRALNIGGRTSCVLLEQTPIKLYHSRRLRSNLCIRQI